MTAAVVTVSLLTCRGSDLSRVTAVSTVVVSVSVRGNVSERVVAVVAVVVVCCCRVNAMPPRVAVAVTLTFAVAGRTRRRRRVALADVVVAPTPLRGVVSARADVAVTVVVALTARVGGLPVVTVTSLDCFVAICQLNDSILYA